MRELKSVNPGQVIEVPAAGCAVFTVAESMYTTSMAVKSPDSFWKVTLLELLGIPVRIHLSFILLVLWIGLSELAAPFGPLGTALFLTGLAASIVLHELGHALAARLFKIPTREIVLYPFGGIAFLGAEPKAGAALVVSLAGPAVSVALFCFGWLALGSDRLLNPPESDGVAALTVTNLALAIFNLLPAYPMDGGRALRGALELFGFKNSTKITANISLVLSTALLIVGILGEAYTLAIIAIYVASQAVKDATMVRLYQAAGRLTVEDIMLPTNGIITLPHGMRVSEALVTALRSFQEWFPVTHLNRAVGVVSKQELIVAANSAESDADEYISGLMERTPARYKPEQPIEDLLAHLPPSGAPPALVEDNGELVGMLPRDKMLEFLLVYRGKGTKDSTAADVNNSKKIP